MAYQQRLVGDPPPNYYTGPPSSSPTYGEAEVLQPPPPAYNQQGWEKFPAQPQYRDAGWIIPFLAQFAGVVFCAIYYFKKNSGAINTTGFTINTKLAELLGITAVAGIIVACLTLMVIRYYAACMIWSFLILGAVSNLALALVFFANGSIIGAIIMGLIFLLSVWWIFVIRSRIPFAVAMLEIVVDVVGLFPNTVTMSIVAVFLHIGWNMLWLFAAVFVYTDIVNNNATAGTAKLVLTFLVFSFYWTNAVISYTSYVTINGVAAEWYFKYPINMSQSPTWQSFTRATTTSFGSVVYGSFLIAVIQTLKWLVESSKEIKNDFVRCILDCILNCLQSILHTVNHWAYTYVSIYGMPYCDACRSTFELFANRGFDVIINEDLISGVLSLASLLAAVIVTIFVYFVGNKALAITFTGNNVVFLVAAFFIGLVATGGALNVIHSKVSAMYVCYAEDPAALAQTKPEIYNKLTGAFMQRFSGKVLMFRY